MADLPEGSRPLVKNASSKRQIKLAKQQLDILNKQKEGDVVALMGTQSGRRFMNNLLAECGVYTLRFNGNVNWLVWDSGMREIGNRYLARIRVWCPNQFALMLNEANAAALAQRLDKEKDPEPQSEEDENDE